MLQEAAHLLRPLHTSPGTTPPGALPAGPPSSHSASSDATAQPMQRGDTHHSPGLKPWLRRSRFRRDPRRPFASRGQSCVPSWWRHGRREWSPRVCPGWALAPSIRSSGTYGWEDLELGGRQGSHKSYFHLWTAHTIASRIPSSRLMVLLQPQKTSRQSATLPSDTVVHPLSSHSFCSAFLPGAGCAPCAARREAADVRDPHRAVP